ncbi:MAG: phage portal protein [Clostridia bacterium]|nr:phage portal protein [Clostridia bacterium]
MSIFDKFGKRKVCATAPQTNSSYPFDSLCSIYPSQVTSPELYRQLREAVPIIDTAIYKLVRLTGGFQVKSLNGKNQQELDDFVRNISVNGTGQGLQHFMDIYFEQLLTYGTSAGEIVTDGNGIHSLYNVPIKNISLKRNPEKFNEILVCNPDSISGTPVKYQDLVMFSALNPEAGSITGTSILKGLPFVSSILLKIYNSIGQNWERAGNLRYAVTYNPGSDMLDRAYAKERATQIAAEWANAMNGSSVKDFVAVGDVQIKVIGADNQILDSEIPVKQLLEQIVSKLSVPPFMLGISWSTTERMSSQQADALTTELCAYRRLLTPVIEKICNLYLRLCGNSSGIEVIWDDITLQDAVEQAKAELYKAQAKSISGGEKND